MANKRRRLDNERDTQTMFVVFFTFLVLLIARGLTPQRFDPLGIFLTQVGKPNNESRRGGVLSNGHPCHVANDDSFRGGVLGNENQWHRGEVEEGLQSCTYSYYDEFYQDPLAVQVTQYEQFEGEPNWPSYYEEFPPEVQQNQALEPLLLQFTTTSPIVHYIMDPNVIEGKKPVEIPKFIMITHGLWEFDDGKEVRYSDEDNEPIEDKSLTSQLETAWPSLSSPSEFGCQTLWSHEWYEHGGKIPLFDTKIEYVTETLHLYQHFDMTKVLSDIKQRLEADDMLFKDTREGVTWYGVYTTRLYDELVEAFHGCGVQLISYYDDIIEDGVKLRRYLLRSLKLYLQYDWGSDTFSVVNDESLLERSLSWTGVKWKGSILPPDDDVIIWFITPDSQNQ